MGIKGLTKFLKNYIPESISEVSLESIRGKIIAIDANYFLYKYTISSNDYVKKFYRQHEHLKRFGIKAFYVFDGKPPVEKQKVIEKRKEVNKKKNIDVSFEKVRYLKEFFRDNNILYLECYSEADFVCCKLNELGFIDGCITDDMDFLTLGCKKIYREYFQHSDKIQEYCLEPTLVHFTRTEFIDICIFLGCDYCDRVHDFVNRSIEINVFELFKKFKTLENVWNYLKEQKMFMFVDEEKEKEIVEKWGNSRIILQNSGKIDSILCYVEVILGLLNNEFSHTRRRNNCRKNKIEFETKKITNTNNLFNFLL